MILDLNPQQSLGDAWIQTAVPHRTAQNEQETFVTAGYTKYKDEDGNVDSDQLAEDIQVFALSAFNDMPTDAVRDDPILTDPRALTTIATLAAVAVDNHRKYADLTDGYAYPDKQLLEDIKQLWQRHVHVQFDQFLSHGETDIIQAVAEAIYSRDSEDTLGPPPGRAVTDITEISAFEELAVEVPIDHLNNNCLVRNEYGEIKTVLEGGNAYVPLSDLQGKMLDATDTAFETHLRAQHSALSNSETQWLISNTTPIHERIDEFFMRQEHDKLFDTQGEKPPLLQVVMNAIYESDAANAKFGEFLSAEELQQFLKDYSPHPAYESAIHTDGQLTPGKLSKKLTHYEENRYLEIDTSGQVYKFKFDSPARKGKKIDVTEPEDIFELPCMASIDEYLRQEGPTRYLLFTMVRLLMSLENDFTNQDIIEMFQRWPWYDKATTEYQVKYERREGKDIKPINCGNDNQRFTAHCIGVENCDYNIYSSLPIKDEIFDEEYDGSHA
jgi:hypothetical protein